MADVNASIGVNIDASNALAEIKSLQRQIASFHTSIAKSSQSAAIAQQDLQRNFINSINSIGSFSAELRTVKTTAENFTTSLEKNKFSMREYFRYAAASTKTFGRNFRSEFDTVNKVAVENVKRLQTQYIKMGRDASGAMKAIAIMPTELDMGNLSTKTQIAAQKQAIFNQLVKQGSTNLLNFGKNTQWAGRQLMVGFTLPLITFGTAASKAFMDMETQAIKFKKVYGDLFTTGPERQKALEEITAVGQAFTKYGIAVSETVGLAAEAAAAGFQGVDLQRQTTEATRLQVLGQIDAQKALETTISLQNAFQMQSADLADSINFLNAVENQTVVSLDDITTAIPKAAPVVRQLGGDVKDLAFFMAAMKEGGINASEGANALKSGLASLINPTNKAKAMLADFGINIDAIVNKNAGNVKQTVIEFALALDNLSDLNRQRAIEQLFGKFQLARLSTLFDNVTKSGNQASRVLDLATASTSELASMAEQELGMTADSAMNKFRKSVEDLKFALVPVGEVFVQVITPFIEKIGGLIEKFNNLSDGTKKVITLLTVGIGGIAPIVLMTIGLMSNFIANGVKGLMILRNGYLRLTGQSKILGEQTQYLTVEQQNALAAAHSLEQSHANLVQLFTVETSELTKLKRAYEATTIAQNKFALTNPGMMLPGYIKPTKRAKGKPVTVGGTGNKDTELALLTPGETVIPAEMSKRYGALINGMIAGNIPGYQDGLGTNLDDVEIKAYRNATIYLQDWINQQLGSSTGASMKDVIASLRQSGGAAASPLLAVMADSMGTSVDDPKLFKDFELAGTKIVDTAITALEKSGKTFVTDLDLEEIVVPAIRKEAEAINIGGKSAAKAINSAIDEVRTVAMVGSGTGSAVPRTSLGKSYIDVREKAQALAMRLNPFVFRKGERPSKSSPTGTKTQFQMKNVENTLAEILPDPGPSSKEDSLQEKALKKSLRSSKRKAEKKAKENALKEYTGAQASHIMPGITATAKEVEARVSGIISNAHKRIQDFAARVVNENKKRVEKSGKDLGETAVKSVSKGAKTESPSKATTETGKDVAKGVEVGMQKGKPGVIKEGEKLGAAAVSAVDKGAKKKRKRSSRAQGPAPIGPNVPAGVQPLSIVAPLTAAEQKKEQRRQTKANMLSRVKSVPSRVGRLGGGMGVIGANMALSAVPDFAGKGILQGGLTGAGFGMMFGPLGTAVGAAVGTAVSALNTLIAKSKETAATMKATFTASSDLITLFGDKVLDTTLKINIFKDSTKNVATSFGLISPEIQKIVDQIKALPEDNPIAMLVKNLSSADMDLQGLAGNIRTQITNAISTGGLDPKNAKNYILTILAASNRTKDFAEVWKSVQKDIKDAQTATTTNLNKLNEAVTRSNDSWTSLSATEDIAIKSYKELTPVQKLVSDQMLTLFKITGSGQLTLDQIKQRIQGIKDSSLSGAAGVTALSLAIKNTKNQDAIDRLNRIKELIKSAGQEAKMGAADILMFNAVLQTIGEEGLKKWASEKGYRKISMADIIRRYFNTKEFKDAQESMNKLINGVVTPTTTTTTKDISFFDKELTYLNNKRNALQEVNSELKRQNDYQQKQMDFINQATQAKVTGNYIQAAIIGQQSKFAASEYLQQSKENQLDKIINITQAAKTVADKRKSLVASDTALIKNISSGNFNAITKLAKTPDVGLNYPSGASTVYNINMSVTGTNDPTKTAELVIKKLNTINAKNNKSNAVLP